MKLLALLPLLFATNLVASQAPDDEILQKFYENYFKVLKTVSLDDLEHIDNALKQIEKAIKNGPEEMPEKIDVSKTPFPDIQITPENAQKLILRIRNILLKHREELLRKESAVAESYFKETPLQMTVPIYGPEPDVLRQQDAVKRYETKAPDMMRTLNDMSDYKMEAPRKFKSGYGELRGFNDMRHHEKEAPRTFKSSSGRCYYPFNNCYVEYDD